MLAGLGREDAPNGVSPAALRAGVELVLENDRRGLAVDPRTVRLSLRTRWRAAGPAAFHRPDTLLREVARQSLVPERYPDAEPRADRIDPRPGDLGLTALAPRGLERQPDDDLGDVLLGDDPRERGDLRRLIRGPWQGRKRHRPAAVIVRDREADASLTEIDAEDSRHGTADWDDDADAEPLADPDPDGEPLAGRADGSTDGTD